MTRKCGSRYLGKIEPNRQIRNKRLNTTAIEVTSERASYPNNRR
jgi:hypothetical protein